MLKITQRDRIFAAIAIPAALLAAYIFLVRAPLARNVDSMRVRLATLGDADTLRAERTVLDRRLAEGREALRTTEEAESARRDAEAQALSDGTAAPADASARLRRAIALLGAPPASLRITSSELLAEGDSASLSAPLVREAIGGQPATLWRFTAVAGYSSIVAALRAISDQSLPVVVERATLEAPPASSTSSARTWQLDICL
jgi:hypothetical protein